MDKELYLKISKPLATCILCGASLAEAGKHPSALVVPVEESEGEEDDLPRREDYCPQCWEKCKGKEFFGYWLAKREPLKPRKVQNRRERNARLAAYFDYFYHQDRELHASRLFFLAHLLMRYGVLRWLRTEKDPENNSERIICRNLVTDEEVVIESAQPTDEELVAIKREIDELLLGTLSSAPVEGTSEESAPEAGTAPTSSDTPEA